MGAKLVDEVNKQRVGKHCRLFFNPWRVAEGGAGCAVNLFAFSFGFV